MEKTSSNCSKILNTKKQSGSFKFFGEPKMVVQLHHYKNLLLETTFVIVQDDPLEDSGLFWHLSARQH